MSRSACAAAASGLLASTDSEANELSPEPPETVLTAGGVEIRDAYLAARIELLEQRSPRFGAAMSRARQGSIPIVIGTPDQVRDLVAERLSLGLQMGNDRVADFLIHTPDVGSPQISLIVIRVHLDRIRGATRWRAPLGIGRGRARRWMNATTDAMLIHELWGHLIPIVEAGDYTGNCSDPAPGQPDLESCVMQRENELRRELGLKPRAQYSLRLL